MFQHLPLLGQLWSTLKKINRPGRFKQVRLYIQTHIDTCIWDHLALSRVIRIIKERRILLPWIDLPFLRNISKQQSYAVRFSNVEGGREPWQKSQDYYYSSVTEIPPLCVCVCAALIRIQKEHSCNCIATTVIFMLPVDGSDQFIRN